MYVLWPITYIVITINSCTTFDDQSPTRCNYHVSRQVKSFLLTSSWTWPIHLSLGSLVMFIHTRQSKQTFLIWPWIGYRALGVTSARCSMSIQLMLLFGFTLTKLMNKPFQSGVALDDVLWTVNFKDGAPNKLDRLFNMQPDKPVMVMEWWTGWFDYWGVDHQTWSDESFGTELKSILG